MKDIETQDDLYFLVDHFYQKLLSDASISYLFTEVVKIKLEEHLPILVTFWSQAIFDTGGYFNNLTKKYVGNFFISPSKAYSVAIGAF